MLNKFLLLIYVINIGTFASACAESTPPASYEACLAACPGSAGEEDYEKCVAGCKFDWSHETEKDPLSC